MHPSVLIADAYKSSLVMTSEIFKDRIAGTVIDIVKTGKDCLALITEKKFDMVVVDFDLPDADGVTLVKMLRKVYNGPILLTAFPDQAVSQAIEQELFAYRDVSEWIRKPVHAEVLNEKIDRYLTDGQRLRRRYKAALPAMLVGKGAGRGKRAPKVVGEVVDIGIGGARVQLSQQLKMKIGEEVLLNLTDLAPGMATSTLPASKKSSAKIRGTIAWADKSKKEAGVFFAGLADSHKKALEDLMRMASEID